MSKVKRLLSIMVAMVMVLAMSVPAFAGTGSATITVNNLDANASLKVLQIIETDTTKETGWKFVNGADTYFKEIFTGLTNQQILWKLIKSADPAATVPTGTTTATAADFQSAMKKVEDNLSGSYVTTGVYGNVITVTKAGVYAIKATTTDTTNYTYNPMAAYISFKAYTNGVPTALENATVNAKGAKTTIEKTNNEVDGVVEIDKEVTYTVKTNVPYIPDAVENVEYTITDTIKGAEYVLNTNSKVEVSVKIGDADPITKEILVTKDEDQNDQIVIDLSTVAKDRTNANKTVVITYKAIVKAEKVENTVVPNDGSHEFTPTTNTLYTGKIKMTKTAEDGKTTLAGAGFVVYRVVGKGENAKNLYAVVEKDTTKTTNNEYVVKSWTESETEAKATLIETDAKGEAVVRGLDDSYIYFFKEIVAPEGYSVNTTDSEATWIDGRNASSAASREGSASMTDTKLSALPSTGGIGTTIFTIGGCAIMIVAAGLFFATRRKTQK